jgi:curli biogenesis system outer membrane secretion channel CsgG
MKARLACCLAGIISVSGCVTPNIAIRQNFDFSKIRRVALVNFRDYPDQSDSGHVVAGAFEQALLKANYDVVERQQVDQILQEHTFSASGVVDPKTAKTLGKMLGVDALVMGSITDFSPAKSDMVLTDVEEERTQPVVVKKTKRRKQGEDWADVEQDVVEGYRTRRTTRQVPQTYTIDAVVGVAVRMVSVETGQVLWAGSSSERGLSVEEAAQSLAWRILRAVKITWPKSPEQP